MLIQQHHYQAVPAQADFSYDDAGGDHSVVAEQPPQGSGTNGVVVANGISTAALLECEFFPNSTPIHFQFKNTCTVPASTIQATA